MTRRRAAARPCKGGCGRPVRKRRGAIFCSPCIAKQPKKACRACGESFAPDLMRGNYCIGDSRKRAHGSRLTATYSITRDQYDAILAAQGGGCAICGRVLTQRNYCVDHDHSCCAGPTSCGKCVRGLICSTDNKYLGYIRDRPEVGGRIAQYLESPPARKVLG